MTDNARELVRVRFAPSPTGYLHIGGARTVLFNWLVARKAGGTFVLRIEDTDRTRHVEDSVRKILDDLCWLGFDWDEGPEIGGDYGPYFQSRRLDIYDRYLQQLLDSGNAYYALETPEQLQAMREAATAKEGGFRYPRPDPLPTIEQGLAARAEGRAVVMRFKMPDEDITVSDEILGEVRLAADQHEDFVIQKGDGFPTYHLACVVDDELMEITHVLRGQEHLMNTPKHVALQRALGFAVPKYAHLPVIFNMDGSKMSKRDKDKAVKKGLPPPEIDVHDFRMAGYIPEAVVNFISLLGWSVG
ncbi:MAG: glutamate--tRNA ligase, partial [Phycisphaerales bacterium]